MQQKKSLRDVASHLPPIALPQVSALIRLCSDKELITLYSLTEPWEELGELFLARRTRRSRLDIGTPPQTSTSDLLEMSPAEDEWFVCEAKDIRSQGWQMLDHKRSFQEEMRSVGRQLVGDSNLSRDEAKDIGPSMFCITGLKNFGKDSALDLVESQIQDCRRLPLVTTRQPRADEIGYKDDSVLRRHLFMNDTRNMSAAVRFQQYVHAQSFIAWRYRVHCNTYYGLEHPLTNIIYNTFPNSTLLTACGLRLSRLIQLQFASNGIAQSRVPKIIYAQALNEDLALKWQSGREDSEDETYLRQRYQLHYRLAHRWVNYVVWMNHRSDLADGVASFIENLKRQK